MLQCEDIVRKNDYLVIPPAKKQTVLRHISIASQNITRGRLVEITGKSLNLHVMMLLCRGLLSVGRFLVH